MPEDTVYIFITTYKMCACAVFLIRIWRQNLRKYVSSINAGVLVNQKRRNQSSINVIIVLNQKIQPGHQMQKCTVYIHIFPVYFLCLDLIWCLGCAVRPPPTASKGNPSGRMAMRIITADGSDGEDSDRSPNANIYSTYAYFFQYIYCVWI